MKTVILSILMIALVGAISSCKKASDPHDENEHEAINKVEFTFMRSGVLHGTYLVEDPDGDGGNPPTRIDTIRLQPGQSYTLSIKIKNLVGTAEKDLTPEVVAQGTAHEIFLTTSGVAVNVTRTDKDTKGYPLGLASTWTTGPTGLGNLQVRLQHKPDVKGPADPPTLGATDLQLNVPIKVQ